MSPSETLAYTLLLNGISWVSQSHGEPGFRAYGFLPNRALSVVEQNRAIETAYTTFVSYDPRKANEFGDYPRPLNLCYQHDLAYINAHPDFVRAALVNYFEASLPGRGFPVTMIDDEETGAECQVDEVGLARFAAECADHFIANAIEVRCFLAEPDTYSLAEHGAHMGRAEPSSEIERLVDAS